VTLYSPRNAKKALKKIYNKTTGRQLGERKMGNQVNMPYPVSLARTNEADAHH
jgi:hypothetical protein